MKSEVKRWGNSGAVRLPSKVLAQARLEMGSPINIEVKDGQIIIQPLSETGKFKLPFTEAELLKGLDRHSGHGEELAQPSRLELGDE